jgi:tetratricopeptide (TPR) repeat protein
MTFTNRFLRHVLVTEVCLVLLFALTAAVVAAGEDIAPLINSGKNLFEQKRYDDAITAFTAALIRDPKSRDAYRLRGITYRAMKKYEESTSDFTRAIALDPEGYDLYAGRAITKREMNDLSGAIEDMTTATRLAPQKDALRVTMLLAAFKFDAGDYTGSLDACSRAKQIQPSPDTANCVGKSMLKLGLYEKAILEFDSIIAVNDRLYYVFLYRAEAHLELGNLDKAHKDFDRAIELKPELAKQKDIQDELAKLAAMQKAALEKQAQEAADAKAAAEAKVAADAKAAKEAADAKAVKEAQDAKATKDATDAKAAKEAPAAEPAPLSTGGQSTAPH